MEKQDRIDQLVAENQELLALTKQAFVKREVEKESVPVDEEWEKFAAEHAEELEALEKDEPHAVGGDLQSPTREVRISNPFHLGILPYKVAASIIGILFTAGVAFAAIQVVRNISTPKPQQPSTEQVIDTKPVTSLPADTVKADTIPVEPYVFNNVPLDSMLTAIAVAHNMQVEFENEAARHLRFHFVWKREDSLSRVVEKLNTFEAVNIGMEDRTLVVR